MGVAMDKTRITITMSKQLKELLDKQAKIENRTSSNLMTNILKKYLEEIGDAK